MVLCLAPLYPAQTIQPAPYRYLYRTVLLMTKPSLSVPGGSSKPGITSYRLALPDTPLPWGPPRSTSTKLADVGRAMPRQKGVLY